MAPQCAGGRQGRRGRATGESEPSRSLTSSIGSLSLQPGRAERSSASPDVPTRRSDISHTSPSDFQAALLRDRAAAAEAAHGALRAFALAELERRCRAEAADLARAEASLKASWPKTTRDLPTPRCMAIYA